MKALRTHVEKLLGELIPPLRDVRSIWRAQLYNFSAFKEANQAKELEKIVFGLITDRLIDHEGYVFFCQDDDVILLGKSIPGKVFDELAHDLERQAFGAAGKPGLAPLVTLYDLGIDWARFNEMVDGKIASALANPKPHHPHTAPTAATSKILVDKPITKELPQEAVQRLLQKGLEDRLSRKRPCVLLVEDDPMSLHMARKALEGSFTVQSAANAAEARSAYVTHVPDIVFLDIGLPDTSGHDLINEFIAMDHDAYVVMLSANSFQDSILKAMRRGAKGFVGKPFSRAKLLQYVGQSPHCHLPIPPTAYV